jgi:amidophosphoribosyltransferase
MCGIIGLMVKKPALRAKLGAWAVPILIGMTERGPDSAGLAAFTDVQKGKNLKYSLFADDVHFSWKKLAAAYKKKFRHSAKLCVQDNHATLVATQEPADIHSWLHDQFAGVHVLSVGKVMDVYKDVGSPTEIADKYDFKDLHGTHVVAHTRMATESAVTPDRAHPFTAGRDFCLVHNGTVSNPYSIRRMLEPRGIHFDTDNDTEAVCRFLEWRMREGDTLEQALKHGFKELDGFYTLLMGTENKLALVRDAFSCKPAVVAETDDYVAIASEFHALAHLPNVNKARIFEPQPEQIYVWNA